MFDFLVCNVYYSTLRCISHVVTTFCYLLSQPRSLCNPRAKLFEFLDFEFYKCYYAFVLTYDDVHIVQKWDKGCTSKQKLIFQSW